MLIPESNLTFTPFPYSDVQITRQTYIAFACYYASNILIAYAFTMLVHAFHDVIKVWFFLQVVEFFDYFLTYNEAWFWKIGITEIKFLILAILIIYKVEKCKM